MTTEEAKAWLDANGKNQRWLAEQFGVHEVTVSRWFSKPDLPVKVSAFLAAFASHEPKKELPVDISLDEEVWIALERLAAKKGMTLEKYTQSAIEGLARELALLLLRAREKKVAKIEAVEATSGS